MGQHLRFSVQKNNYRDFFQPGHSFTNTVALDGGDDKSSVRASFTNQNSSGIVPTNDLKRQTIFLRGFTKMKDIIELDGKVTYIHSNVQNRPGVAEAATNPGYYPFHNAKEYGIDTISINTWKMKTARNSFGQPTPIQEIPTGNCTMQQTVIRNTVFREFSQQKSYLILI